MKGVVFVLHGRKNKLSTANLSLVDKVASWLTCPYEIGLLEGNHYRLEEAITSLLAKKVEEIIFLPILLFPATHAQEDLPQRVVASVQEKCPYQILETLGTTQAISRYVSQQVIKADDSENRKVLLIAHGTPHYSEPYVQLEQVAKKVAQATHRCVYPAHYYGDHLYQEVINQHSQPFIIQRLFLTEGYLARKIKQEIIDQRGLVDTFLPTLQNQPALEDAVVERLAETGCLKSKASQLLRK